MKSFVRFAVAASVMLITAQPVLAQANDPGRLYGRVVTMDGTEFEGFIRWDNNEGHWTDQLDASKRLPRRFMREAERLSGERYERERPVRVLGIRVGSERESRWSNSASATIRFGHIRQIQVLDDTHGLLVLKSGEEQELSRSSSDLGRSLDLVVEEVGGGQAELGWDDIDFIEFMPAPAVESPFGARLYGTLTTRGGDEFSGWITWDRDEIFGVDELDGRASSRRSRSVPFSNITAIERESSSRARVSLADGREITMSGTNDVNRENRGIFISDPGLGRVEVKWDEFRDVQFHEPPANLSYDMFDGGRRLEGTVYGAEGESYTGTIRWDNDEQWTWEGLDGDFQGIEFDVEFGMIRTIERVSYRSSRITLLDGRDFLMRGSNDVNDENKGIFVRTQDGETVMLYWDELDRVEFSN